MILDLEKFKTLSYTEGGVVSIHKMVVYPIVSNTDDDEMAPDYDGGLAVEEEKPKLKPPKQYKVMVVNDDYTPMEFVVEVLMTYFAMDDAKATRVMMSVHTKGQGICGVFSHEIAETKVSQVNEFSRLNQHPLMCTMEED